MIELGQLLKTARENKGLSIEDLQERTKIQKRYIEAIENGNYSLLPGPFYTRAFIKNIAETLGVNAESLLEQYQDQLPVKSKESTIPLPRRRRRKISNQPLIGPWITRLLFILFILIVGFIIYIFYVDNAPINDHPFTQENPLDHEPGQLISPSENEPEEEPVEDEVIPEPADPVITFIKEEIKQKNRVGYYELSHADHFEITMKASRGRVWFNFKKGEDGAVIESRTFEKDVEQSWEITDSDEVYFHFGATKYMDLIVNGQVVDLSEKPDAYIVSIKIKRDQE